MMSIEQIKERIQKQFTGIVLCSPQKRWNDRSVLLGFRVLVNDAFCYVFLGQNGVGKQVKGQRTAIPLYCEIALEKGGNIEEKLGPTGRILFRLLPEYKRKNSYYRFASFAENELEAAGQKLMDVLALILPEPVC